MAILDPDLARSGRQERAAGRSAGADVDNNNPTIQGPSYD